MSEAVLYDTVGPRGQRRILVGSVVGVLLVVVVLGAAVARLAAKGQARPRAIGRSSPRARCSG